MPPVFSKDSATEERRASKAIQVTGIVQGVGFRPFVYGLATRYGLKGWVCNSSGGVDIEVDGPEEAVRAFLASLREEAPSLAHIDRITVAELSGNGFETFEIRESVTRAGRFQPISPDVATCEDCLREVFDPADRRFRYPFTNCTNCGPRFTIIQEIPYDRPNTTMRTFRMCPVCAGEYRDPANRRFHAQPNACPRCGPKLWLEGEGGDPVRGARRLLAEGQVVAVKGVGGFHLACDATSDVAVRRLRERKGRIEKPFALMSFDLEAVKRYCHVGPEEERLLLSRERPIVLLRERHDSPVSLLVAPGQKYLGVMLPYSPLHSLLLEPAGPWKPLALVMTSGNLSEEPICRANDEALHRLEGLADAFLFHDRPIHASCDDSVVRIFRGRELPLRRSRGYAPFPVHLPFPGVEILACGAELKNTFCVTKEGYAFLSHHIGDVENLETLAAFEAAVEHYQRLFRVAPSVLAHDLHPDYLSTRYAVERARREAVTLVPVQHHHAHIAACMAEHGLRAPVLGVAFDGTGYGSDGRIWGGEFLLADYQGFRRVAHTAYVPLPGGEAAIRRPYRMALSHLYHALGTLDVDLPWLEGVRREELQVIRRQLETGLNCPLTSSMGRLFDAVSALIGLVLVATYEAQAAMALEMVADGGVEESYEWTWARDGYPPPVGEKGRAGERPEQGSLPYADPLVVNPAPLIRRVVEDLHAGIPPSTISAKFHNAVAGMVRDVLIHLRQREGVSRVVLSGGVFQNTLLLERTLRRLEAARFEVYTHRRVPSNDGGIALGQAAVASVRTGGSIPCASPFPV